MKQKEYFNRIVSVLRATGCNKRVPQERKTFTITDCNNHSKKFSVMEPPKSVNYTQDDIGYILAAAVEVARAALRSGDRVRINGLGTFSVAFRQEYVSKDPRTGDLRVIKEHYSPKFQASKALKKAARDYADHLLEQELEATPVLQPDELDEFYEEFDDYSEEEELDFLDELDIDELDDEFDDADVDDEEDAGETDELEGDDYEF